MIPVSCRGCIPHVTVPASVLLNAEIVKPRSFVFVSLIWANKFLMRGNKFLSSFGASSVANGTRNSLPKEISFLDFDNLFFNYYDIEYFTIDFSNYSFSK